MENRRNKEINKLTKESIALAAGELITAAKPYSVTEICKNAGVSRNAYYRNFQSVDEIIIYYLILKWARYCEKAGINQEPQPDMGHHLMQYFYSQRTFMNALRSQKRLYLIEQLFRMVIIPKDIAGAGRYLAYIQAYAIYGMIRAAIDNDFSETPEELRTMLNVKDTQTA